MNFNRNKYLKNNILPKLVKYKNIDEILISHGKKDTYFEYPNGKVKNFKDWDLNKNFGLTLRFVTAARAKNNSTLIMDDDIIPSESSITFLLNKLNKERDTIHGVYGRILNVKNDNLFYDTSLIFGKCHVVLTRLLMADRSLSIYFLNNYSKFEDETIKNSKPYWNGEDILFSLLSIKKNNKLPKTYDLKHENRNILNEVFNLGISSGKRHIGYRSEISKKFVKKLSIDDIIKTKINLEKKNNTLYEIYNSNLFYYLIFFILFFIISILTLYYKYKFNI